jgi:hypothetical protein
VAGKIDGALFLIMCQIKMKDMELHNPLPISSNWVGSRSATVPYEA